MNDAPEFMFENGSPTSLMVVPERTFSVNDIAIVFDQILLHSMCHFYIGSDFKSPVCPRSDWRRKIWRLLPQSQQLFFGTASIQPINDVTFELETGQHQHADALGHTIQVAGDRLSMVLACIAWSSIRMELRRAVLGGLRVFVRQYPDILVV